VDIPVYLCSLGEAVVSLAKEEVGEEGGDDEVDELVEGGSAEDVVRVEGQRVEVEGLGVGEDSCRESFRTGGDEVLHGDDGGVASSGEWVGAGGSEGGRAGGGALIFGGR